MKILGKEIKVSFTDVDFMEKADFELNKINSLKEQEFKNQMEELKITCKIIKEFFGNIFNEDFSDVKNDYMYLIEEFENFTTNYVEETKKAKKQLDDKFSKYDLKRIQR